MNNGYKECSFIVCVQMNCNIRIVCFVVKVKWLVSLIKILLSIACGGNITGNRQWRQEGKTILRVVKCESHVNVWVLLQKKESHSINF